MGMAREQGRWEWHGNEARWEWSRNKAGTGVTLAGMKKGGSISQSRTQQKPVRKGTEMVTAAAPSTSTIVLMGLINLC